MSKTYIPKMGPKKAVAPPERRKVNYDNGRNLMTRDLKNWYRAIYRAIIIFMVI